MASRSRRASQSRTAEKAGPEVPRQNRASDLPNLPIIDAGAPQPDELRPSWRGWIHAGVTPVALVLGIVLIVLAHGPVAKWSCAVYYASSLLLFGNSALYHRFRWKPKVKAILKRIDHANIFLLIAGTYTPLSLVALRPDHGILLLCLVWGVALLGIGFRVFWITAPRWLYVPLYLLLGWAAVMFIVELFEVNAAMMTLVVIGGVLYSIGAAVYGFKKPNPWPHVFGFHEIFHTLTVLAFLSQWTGILLVCLDPPRLS